MTKIYGSCRFPKPRCPLHRFSAAEKRPLSIKRFTALKTDVFKAVKRLF
jgi:hypothetical protein